MRRMSRPDAAELELPDARWRQSLRRKLVAWFRRHRRDLPWRRSRDPYRVWLSEIMLQQTQVTTVIPYFERFLVRFPELQTLAAAEEAEVFKLWEGMGYYRRARQLHAAAKQIVAEHGGMIPREFEAIRSLPGIGRYTAGAIASIAFDTRSPILEANTVRLYSRLLAYRGEATSLRGQELLWRFVEAILPARGAGDMNQALMELGSLVCTPREPKCEVCPARSLCPTFKAGLHDEIPLAKRKVRFEAVREAAVVVRRGNKVLLRQRPQGERWAGLWDFARFPLIAQRGAELATELRQKTLEQTGVRVEVGEQLTILKHGVTRFRITLYCYEAKHVSGKAKQHDGATLTWTTPDKLGDYPLSVTGRKLARLLATTASGHR